MTEHFMRYVFGPCRDGQHSECHVKLGNRECSCECGHRAQQEREVKA